MKKTSLLVSLLLAGMTITIAGCNSGGPSAKNLKQINPYEYETTYRGMRINGSGYTAEQYTEHKNESGQRKFVIEDVKALVIPVDFTDCLGSDLPLGEEGTKQELEKMMFGSNDELEWYSLAGYYASSSFGQCKISGTVGDWYHVDSTIAEYANKNGTSGAQLIAIEIQDLYRSEYSMAKMLDDEEKMAKYDLTQYDANKDGFIDSLILIYSAPIHTTGELQWAFCWNVPGAYGRYNPELEGVNRFFWASYWFFYDGYLNHKTKYPTIPDDLPQKIIDGEVEPDVHTMTHEYGHVLGLPDYYITDYSGTDFDGLGYLDMMDYNIGDHNAASKAWYGWVNPYYATGSVKATIRSTTTTGDCIILPIGGQYNNTLMDQYLMIEFLTPEGVAKYDGEHQFNGSYPLYFNKAGIRVIHVDARLGVFTYNQSKSQWQFTGFTSSTSAPGDRSYVGTACDNTASDSCFPDYKLLEFLPRDGVSIKTHKQASGDLLFQEGDVFGSNGIYENYMMHDKAGGKTVPLGFKFEITKINGYESAEINITKI